MAQLPGLAVTAPQTSVTWEGSAVSELDSRVPCGLCCGPKDRVPSSVCLAPVQGGLLVCVHVTLLWQTQLGFAGVWTPSGCGPEVRAVAAEGPSLTARVPSDAVGSRPGHSSRQQPSWEGSRDLLFSCEQGVS